MMNTAQTATIVRLGDTKMTVTDRAEDVRGRKVLDSGGEEVGKVDELLLDERESKVRFLEVASGGFLGLGETKFLIPVDAITAVTPEAVKINQTRQHVAGSPKYNPSLADEKYLGDVYGHYGYGPYWGAGYVYPPYPQYNKM